MTTSVEPARCFSQDVLAGLDEPVRRYFDHAFCWHAPLTANVRLTMVGRIKVGPVWLAFTAEHVFKGHEFVWRARAGWGPFRPLHVVDQYEANAGTMNGRMFGRLSFLHTADENTTRASAARGAVESIWVPSSLLAERGVIWRAENQNVIVAAFEVAAERPEVRVTIDDAGAVLSVGVMRWGNADQDDYGYIPLGGNVSADRRFGDFVLPITVSVGWWFGTDRFTPFFEAKIITAVPISLERASTDESPTRGSARELGAPGQSADAARSPAARPQHRQASMPPRPPEHLTKASADRLTGRLERVRPEASPPLV